MNKKIVFLLVNIFFIDNLLSMSFLRDEQKIEVESKFLFESKRLYFRKFTFEDANDLIPILGDKEVMEYCLSHEAWKKIFHAMSKEEINAFLLRVITSYKENGWGRYAIIKKDNNELIGYCGLKMQSFDNGKSYPELGYRLAKKYWNLGYATESACATRDYVNKVLKLLKIISLIDPSNIKSINVINKAGFKFWKIDSFYDFPVNLYKINFDINKFK